MRMNKWQLDAIIPVNFTSIMFHKGVIKNIYHAILFTHNLKIGKLGGRQWQNPMLGKIESKRRVQQRMKWLDSITTSTDMNLSRLQEIGEDRKPGVLQSRGVPKTQTPLNDGTTTMVEQRNMGDSWSACNDLSLDWEAGYMIGFTFWPFIALFIDSSIANLLKNKPQVPFLIKDSDDLLKTRGNTKYDE